MIILNFQPHDAHKRITIPTSPFNVPPSVQDITKDCPRYNQGLTKV